MWRLVGRGIAMLNGIGRMVGLRLVHDLDIKPRISLLRGTVFLRVVGSERAYSFCSCFAIAYSFCSCFAIASSNRSARRGRFTTAITLIVDSRIRNLAKPNLASVFLPAYTRHQWHFWFLRTIFSIQVGDVFCLCEVF